jgi:hypothetical protein
MHGLGGGQSILDRLGLASGRCTFVALHAAELVE